ncbi:hypothetical protein EVAR_101838_1 [Eumeta japonica]|uniref:Uncharacterized protein n=1 Tax=Eumeta variegata TaxID=151549 RepID=A0A4C1SMW6_EUMVA|nr:hypothetical protein EVAR_101838_1 [Eumeta japonica]
MIRQNLVLHQDLELPTISKFMKDASERSFDIASSHPNPLIVSAVSHEHRLRISSVERPRNILSGPSDAITVKVEEVIEVNNIAIDWK